MKTKIKIDSLLLFYFILPSVLFLLFWVKIIIAIPIIILLFISFFYQLKSESKSIDDINLKNILAVGLFSLLLCYFGGVGGFVSQTGDYEKHNQIYSDLIQYQLPITYSNGDLLCYYLAYYLPTALITKILGISITGTLSFAYTFIGVFLGLLSIINHFKIKQPFYFLFVFLFIGGFDFLKVICTSEFIQNTKGLAINLLHKNINQQMFVEYIRFFVARMNDTRMFFTDFQMGHSVLFVSQIGQFILAPQHLLGAWISSLLIYKFTQNNSLIGASLVFCCTMFWSPFVFVGQIPFILYLFFKKNINITKRELLLSSLSFPTLIIVLIYFKSHYPDLSGLEFLPASFSNITDYLIFLLFLLIEVGIYYLIITFLNRKHSLIGQKLPIFHFTIITLCIISCFNMGIFNDFIIRASLPSLIIFYLISIKFLFDIITGVYKKKLKLIVGVLILFSTLEGFSMCLLHYYTKEQIPQSSIQKPNFKNVTEVTYEIFGSKLDISKQYLGKKKSFFVEYIMKK